MKTTFQGDEMVRARRIMFIDDDPFLGTLARLTLQRLGYEAETFLDPASALEAFTTADGAYDLVLCDVRIDKASGFDLVRTMKDVRPDVAVLMVSGAVEQQDLVAGRDVGALAVLPKSEVMINLAEALAPYLR